MTEQQLHHLLTLLEIALALITLPLLCVIAAPYGRHSRPGWGPTIGTRLAWVLMEFPTVALLIPVFLLGNHASEPIPLIFLFIWLSHYVHRTFIFPLHLQPGTKETPILIVLFGAAFNSLNAYVNARFISHFGVYEAGWLADPRFVGGLALFVIGYAINRDADRTLITLRKDGRPGRYHIPRGRMYRYVSCPNYLGEMIEWTGFAVLTWSLPAFAFALYTAANVGPRAISNHRWYREKFDEYPKERRALIPFLL